MTNNVKVLITVPFSDELVEVLNDISPRLEIQIIKTRKVDEIPAEIWQQIEVLYTHSVIPDREQAPNLRWIQFHWAGVDHILEDPIFQENDLIATTLSGAGASKMAEFILAMLLAQGLKIPDLLENQREHKWPKNRWEQFQPRELRDSTVGIIGYGSIGRQVAKLLEPFGTRVLAAKKDAMNPRDEGYVVEGFGDQPGDYATRLYPAEAVNSILKESDFVVVSVPLTKSTQNLISAEQFSAVKPGAYLVDISRGGVVDHEALINALNEGQLSGAALDVFPEEPLPENSPLWDLPNVIITPHVSGVTRFYDKRAVELFKENLKLYLEGSPLLNTVDLEEKGY